MTTTVRRLRRGAVTLAALCGLFILVGGGTSAAGATNEIECDPHEGYTCLYEGDWLKGLGPPVRSGDCWTWGFSYNRMVNYTGYYQRMWTNANCTGISQLVRPGEDLRAGMGFVSQGGY